MRKKFRMFDAALPFLSQNVHFRRSGGSTKLCFNETKNIVRRENRLQLVSLSRLVSESRFNLPTAENPKTEEPSCDVDTSSCDLS